MGDPGDIGAIGKKGEQVLTNPELMHITLEQCDIVE